jgi:hypothetical protein
MKVSHNHTESIPNDNVSFFCKGEMGKGQITALPIHTERVLMRGPIIQGFVDRTTFLSNSDKHPPLKVPVLKSHLC